MLIVSKIKQFAKAELFCLCSRQKVGFVAAMAEALDKFEQQQEANKASREAAAEALKKTKLMKQNLKKRKWVDWKTEDEQAAEDGVKRAPFDPADRVKRRKCAMLLSYCGANYFGMQRNPGMQTIEEELFTAMMKHKWITENSFEQAQNSYFQRAARTDKGVSAARQVCSIKLPDEVDIPALNADLPAEIRVIAVQRVTKGFNAKDHCNARTYTYTLPTIAFADFGGEHHYESFRLGPGQLQKVQDVLKLYEGTKNFHNFTSKKNHLDPSAKRYIMSFASSEPFLTPQNIEFLTVKVKGQSFMLHQIRKMVGLAIAIVRGNTSVATLERAFTEERLDLPMAPGLGLVLDTVHYERYNQRYGTDGIHAPLTWEQQNAQINAFIDKYINPKIYETEYKEKSLLAWLDTLSYHSYEPRSNENNEETADVADDNSGSRGTDDNKE